MKRKKGTAGRAPYYETAEALQAAVDAYFASCEAVPLTTPNPDTGEPQAVLDKHGQPVLIGGRPPTVTGLALALGFASRSSLINYQERPEFSDVVTRAKSRVEQYTEERLFDRDGVQGAKFSLANNFGGWSERQESKVDTSIQVKLSGELEEWSK